MNRSGQAADEPSRTIVIGCSGTVSVADVRQRYVDATRPKAAEMFGRYLDALWDAVERDGPGSPGSAGLLFLGTAGLSRLRLASGSSVLDGLAQIAREATRIPVRLS